MESIAHLFKQVIPNYLKSLPIPKSFDGFSHLSGSDVLTLAIFSIAVATVTYATGKHIVSLVFGCRKRPAIVNQKVKKDNPKVVDLVDVEDLDKEKTSYCRCWKSGKFPLCDGSHNKHNEETGDNVGPLVIKKKIN